jgi:hypothetical protein
MNSGNTRYRLFDESISFSLYADYSKGVTVADLARRCSRSEIWIRERIEAARLCLEKQVRIVVPPSEASVCAAEVWAAQVWD